MIVDERLVLLLAVILDSITEVSTTAEAEFGNNVFGDNMLSGTNA